MYIKMSNNILIVYFFVVNVYALESNAFISILLDTSRSSKWKNNVSKNTWQHGRKWVCVGSNAHKSNHYSKEQVQIFPISQNMETLISYLNVTLKKKRVRLSELIFHREKLIKTLNQGSHRTKRQDLPGPHTCRPMKTSLSVRFQHCSAPQPARDPHPTLPTPALWRGSLGKTPGTPGHQNQATWCNESGRSLSSPPSVKADKQRTH